MTTRYHILAILFVAHASFGIALPMQVFAAGTPFMVTPQDSSKEPAPAESNPKAVDSSPKTEVMGDAPTKEEKTVTKKSAKRYPVRRGYPIPGNKDDQFYQGYLRPYSNTTEQDFQPGSPRYYVVQPGDTYHSISQQFLTNPNRWAETWELPQGSGNGQSAALESGSIVVLSKVRGTKFRVFAEGEEGLAKRYGEYYGIRTGNNSIKLKPVAWAKSIRENKLLPSDLIEPHKVRATVVPYADITNAPIIAGFIDNRLMGYPGKEMFVRGHIDENIREWYVYRVEPKKLIDPETFQSLGYVSVLQGVIRPSKRAEDLYAFEVLSAYTEFERGSRLVPVKSSDVRYEDYRFQKPATNIRGRIVGVYGGENITQQYKTVIFNRGAKDGVKRGDVFTLQNYRPVSYLGEAPIDNVPLYGYGRIYAYRVEDNVTFAHVLEAQSEITLYDLVRPISDDGTGDINVQSSTGRRLMNSGGSNGKQTLSPTAYSNNVPVELDDFDFEPSPTYRGNRGLYRE